MKPEGFVTGWSGNSDDLARYNKTLNLNVGFVGEGICSDNSQVHGLEYRCNFTNGDATGIYSRVVPFSPLIDPLQIIRYLQGTSDAPAGNEFIGNAVDLANGNPSRAFEYHWWHNHPNQQPLTTLGLVYTHWSDKDTVCTDYFPVQTIVPGEPVPSASEPRTYRAFLMNIAQTRKLGYTLPARALAPGGLCGAWLRGPQPPRRRPQSALRRDLRTPGAWW